MNDQHRKQSKLSQNLTYDHLRNDGETATPTPTPTPTPAAPAPAPTPAPAPKKPARKQVTSYHDEDALKRAKQAHLFTQGHTGYKGWTEFVEAAVNQHTKDLEAKYNESRPFGS